MFVGQYSHNIDIKGRLAVPAKFRSELKKAVVTEGLDSCLFLYPKKEWDVLAQKLAALPISKANTRAFARLMLASAMDVEVDKQGRIILPEYLRKFAGLKKNVIIAGLYNRLEIWDEDKWNKYKTETEKNSSEIAEALDNIGV
ncbi:division/cell wall cluster transcriptional repressor MraZ [Candidatus Falkowbacteria bacterium]|nr:division/cell wall cluster transcriptional repressor MraZ [Candidatus Falkowbacteria bacterium]